MKYIYRTLHCLCALCLLCVLCVSCKPENRHRRHVNIKDAPTIEEIQSQPKPANPNGDEDPDEPAAVPTSKDPKDVKPGHKYVEGHDITDNKRTCHTCRGTGNDHGSKCKTCMGYGYILVY